MLLQDPRAIEQITKSKLLTFSLAALALFGLVQCDLGLLKDKVDDDDPYAYTMGGSLDSLFFNAAKQSGDYTFYPPLWSQKWDDRMVFTVDGEKDLLIGKTLEATLKIEDTTIILHFDITADTGFTSPQTLNSQSHDSGVEAPNSRAWFKAISPPIRSLIWNDPEWRYKPIPKTTALFSLRLVAKDPNKTGSDSRAVNAQVQYHVDLNPDFFVVAFRPTEVGMSIYQSYSDNDGKSFTKTTVQKIEYLTDSTLELEKCANRAIVRTHYLVQNGYSDSSTLPPNQEPRNSEILFDTAQSRPIIEERCQAETDIVLFNRWDGSESGYQYPIGESYSKTNAFGRTRILRKFYFPTHGGYSAASTEMEGIGDVGGWSSHGILGYSSTTEVYRVDYK